MFAALLAGAALAWLEPGAAGSEDRMLRKDPDPRLEKSAGKDRTPPKSAPLATSERDPVAELQARLVRVERDLAALDERARALEQENQALRDRLDDLEGAVTVESGHLTLATAGTLRIRAARVDAEAATSSFHGVVKADTVQARSVVAETMTPAAGNLW
jgi:hypothetical protein